MQLCLELPKIMYNLLIKKRIIKVLDKYMYVGG